jgi:hypothetical protein
MRRNVSLFTPNCFSAARYVSKSPGSRASIAAVASNIRSRLIKLSRVEVDEFWLL